MAVPNTTTFNFWNVADEVYGDHASGRNLDSAFTDSNAAYFDSNYGSKTMSPKTLYGFRNYGPPGEIISRISGTTYVAIITDPWTQSVTTPSGATMVVVAIKSMYSPTRNTAAPTIGGVSMVSAISSAYAEIWYLNNPPTGTNTLSAVNGSNIHVTVDWFQCSAALSINALASGSGTGTLESVTFSLPANRNVLIFDSVSYPNYSGVIGQTSQSDNGVWFGVIGASFGSSSQYNTFSTGAGGSRSMTNGLSATRLWYGVAASFCSV